LPPPKIAFSLKVTNFYDSLGFGRGGGLPARKEHNYGCAVVFWLRYISNAFGGIVEKRRTVSIRTIGSPPGGPDWHVAPPTMRGARL